MRLFFIVMFGANVFFAAVTIFQIIQDLQADKLSGAGTGCLVLLLNVVAAFFCFASLRTLRARRDRY